MADDPQAGLLIAEVRSLLENGVTDRFQQKVAANALGIALRELTAGPGIETGELARLSSAIRQNDIDDALIGRLIRIALAKIEIDQPNYPPFRAYLRGGD